MITEIVTITEVKDRTSEGANLYKVSYSGGRFDGVLAEFTPKPKVGQQWELVSDFNVLVSAKLLNS